MNVPNHERKAFRDMTTEERSAIVDALIAGDLEVDHGDGWRGNVATVHALYIYRTRPRQLVIPWDLIRPEYKWAAMDDRGNVFAYEYKPEMLDTGFATKHLAAFTYLPLNINTAGIDWRESLTERPEGV